MKIQETLVTGASRGVVQKEGGRECEGKGWSGLSGHKGEMRVSLPPPETGTADLVFAGTLIPHLGLGTL